MKAVQPAYRLSLDGCDLTPHLAPHLVSLTLTECRAEEADQLDLVLADQAGCLTIPKRGKPLSISLGWQDTGLMNKGHFIVDEVEHSGAPDLLTVRARSASMTEDLHQRREHSWHRVTLADIVQTIAMRHRLVPKIAKVFATINLAHIDQTHESDLSFLTRLAKRYDAVMTVKGRHLLWMPIGAARTVSGQPLPVIHLARQTGDQHRYHIAQRESYAGVRADWYSLDQAKRSSVVIGTDNHRNLKVLPEAYASPAEAQVAARAEWQRIQRSQATMTYTLALGRAEIFPEMPVTLTGFKAEIDQTLWLTARVTHTLADGGYTTTLDLEVRGDPASQRHRRMFRRGATHSSACEPLT